MVCVCACVCVCVGPLARGTARGIVRIIFSLSAYWMCAITVPLKASGTSHRIGHSMLALLLQGPLTVVGAIKLF